jgi:hypothetical protein
MNSLRSRVTDLLTHNHPVNKDALNAVLPSAPEAFTSRDQPTLCSVPIEEVLRRNPSKKFTNLTGATVGALTVIGLIEFRGGGASLWATRCVCGNYERRQWASLVRAMNQNKHAACHFCIRDL